MREHHDQARVVRVFVYVLVKGLPWATTPAQVRDLSGSSVLLGLLALGLLAVRREMTPVFRINNTEGSPGWTWPTSSPAFSVTT